MKANVLSRKVLTAVIGGILGLSLANTAVASEGGGHGGKTAAKAPATAEGLLKTVIKQNDEFLQHHDRAYFEPIQKEQFPHLVVVTCSDSSIQTQLLSGDPENNVFVVRNLGNQIKNNEGSVDYGIRHMPAKVLLILGHTDCDAVKTATGSLSHESTGIRSELSGLLPAIAKEEGAVNTGQLLVKNIEQNVDFQVDYAKKLYTDKVSKGFLHVVGAIIDTHDHYGRGRGRLVITNIDGETDPKKLTHHPLLNELDKGEVVNHVGSLAPTADQQ